MPEAEKRTLKAKFVEKLNRLETPYVVSYATKSKMVGGFKPARARVECA
jgi:hypothetical protein